MKINYQDLQKKINVKFKNLDLLIQSLTHKSFDTKKNYEKMEFLGDRVLGLVIVKKLLEIIMFGCMIILLKIHKIINVIGVKRVFQ